MYSPHHENLVFKVAQPSREARESELRLKGSANHPHQLLVSSFLRRSSFRRVPQGRIYIDIAAVCLKPKALELS